jgi:hypothetical protein
MELEAQRRDNERLRGFHRNSPPLPQPARKPHRPFFPPPVKPIDQQKRMPPPRPNRPAAAPMAPPPIAGPSGLQRGRNDPLAGAQAAWIAGNCFLSLYCFISYKNINQF